MLFEFTSRRAVGHSFGWGNRRGDGRGAGRFHQELYHCVSTRVLRGHFHPVSTGVM